MNGWGHPDRDALLYFEAASEAWEEAAVAHRAGEAEAVIAAIKSGLRALGCAARVVTTAKGEQLVKDSIAFWAATLANLEGERAVCQSEEARQLPLWGE